MVNNKALCVSTLALLLVLSVHTVAQTIEFPFLCKNITPVKTNEFRFTVGAHPDASDSVDTAIGEVEIPNIPLPGNIYYVWTVAPTVEDIWISPKEYRKLKSGVKHREDYDLRISWSGGKLELSWSGNLQPGIDSIWITDGYSDFPDNFLSVKVQPGVMLVTENPSITRFKVVVWYDGTISAVEHPRGGSETSIEGWSANNISITPHPVIDGATVKVPPGARYVAVTDMMGRELMSEACTQAEEHELRMTGISRGMYLLTIVGSSGQIISKPFIHE